MPSMEMPTKSQKEKKHKRRSRSELSYREYDTLDRSATRRRNKVPPMHGNIELSPLQHIKIWQAWNMVVVKQVRGETCNFSRAGGLISKVCSVVQRAGATVVDTRFNELNRMLSVALARLTRTWATPTSCQRGA